MHRRTRTSVCAALCVASLLWPTRTVPQSVDVDLALVLAIDCSFSVDAAEFGLQMKGLGQALQNLDVWDAIQRGPNHKIAITAFQWSDKDNQKVILSWQVVDSAQIAIDIGIRLQTMPRLMAEGGTSITNALLFSEQLFDTAPVAFRRVIDVSTDGRNNIGPALPPVRNAIVNQGITINALVILNEVPTLDIYAEKQITGGQGNFVDRVKNYESYGDAILRKLVREIVGPGIT
jgi:hypothetical protein